ncbi:MAG: hypothetical protein OEX07_05135 [Gammaproteobacteria bacterium]|nr:hypothetical protein [Gammaproteobacteria bacterium]
MSTPGSGLKLFAAIIVAFSGSSYAALPIAECKTFLDEELELMCLKSSIEARIEEEIPFNSSVVMHKYDSGDVEFRSNRLISLSPEGTVNYDIHHHQTYYCNPLLYRCKFAEESHLYNPFMDRVLDGEKLSYDDPAYSFYEMKYFVEYGKAYVSLKKRLFDVDNNEKKITIRLER